jgi:hypothetical protein
MTELHGRIIGNTIVLDSPPNLPEGQEVRVQIETVSANNEEGRPRKAGIIKGKAWMSDDFNETPPDFEEYTR